MSLQEAINRLRGNVFLFLVQAVKCLHVTAIIICHYQIDVYNRGEEMWITKDQQLVRCHHAGKLPWQHYTSTVALGFVKHR